VTQARPVARPLSDSMALVAAPSILLVLAPFLVLLATEQPLGAELLLMAAAVAVLPAATPFVLRMVGRTWDPLLLSPAWVLCALGLAVIARVQPQVVPTQMLWIGVGWSAFIALAGFPPLLTWLRRYRYVWLSGALLLAVLTLLVGDDVTGQGARLWLQVGPVTVQPAELLRVLLIAFFAGHLAERVPRIEGGDEALAGSVQLRSLLHDWLPILGMFAIAVLVVLAQRDFGPSLIFAAVLIGMLYLATGRRDYVVLALVLGVLMAVLVYLGSDRIQGRVDAWLDPWSDPRGAGYQSLQALGAFVFGGVFGTGPGYGAPGLIPAAHTDYPLAVIGEEWGLLGSLAVVSLYGLIVVRSLARARMAGDAFSQLLSAGLGIGLAVQVLVVFGGVLRMGPLTGLTSPFLSYGGSSMLLAWVTLALLTAAGDRGDLRPRGALPRLPRIEVRSRELGLVALAGFAAVALTLGYWQVARADLAASPSVGGERLRVEEARVQRGRILDRNGVVLAETELGPDGEPRRVYEADGAVHVLGFTSSRVGGSGVESVAADQLMGRTLPNPRDTLRDILHLPRAGEDVRLTIDARLQQVAVEAMDGALGAVVAIDPRTGEILAMVSNPTFDPDFSEEEWDVLRTDPTSPLLNRATQGLYTPGSTYKTVTLAAALEYGLVTLDTPATCPAEVFIDGVRIISNNEPAGRHTETVADAYAYSCNTYFAQLGIEVGEERFRAMAEAFGLTEEIPFPLPTEAGRLSTSKGFLDSGAGLAASAFGQGELQFTPLHLALVTAAIANGGVIEKPRLFLDDETTEWRRPVSPKTARALREAMEYGVEVGWASTVAIPGIRVGGKTGSAEVVVEESPHALFIAFAPVGDPSIAVVVIKERAGSGSQQAGPVAKRLIEAWLGYQSDDQVPSAAR
jgi:cell division protein FtsI/penicillin-binding protein 2/cell division protein FtsW (lipid II flippase)